MVHTKKSPAYRVAFMGLLLALALVLSLVEQSVSSLIIPIQGVKLGLSNMITMYALFFLGTRSAFLIAGLKSAFVFLIRGPVAFFMSISGGMLSVCCMFLLFSLKRARFSSLLISICGAVSHNIGQICAAALWMQTAVVFTYLPVLVLSGVLMGCITGILLRVILPGFRRAANFFGYFDPDRF